MSKSELMRVPTEFKEEVRKLQKKHGYDSMSELLRGDGVRIFRNADKVTSAMKGLKNLFMRE